MPSYHRYRDYAFTPSGLLPSPGYSQCPSFRDAPVGAGPESITTAWGYGFRARAARAPERRRRLGLFLEKSSRFDQRQLRDGPVVEIGPGLAWRAVGERDRKHLADILRRLGKSLAASLVHVEL